MKVNIDGENFTLKLGEWVRTATVTGRFLNNACEAGKITLQVDTDMGTTTVTVSPEEIVGIGKKEDSLVKFLNENPTEPAMKEHVKDGKEKPKLSLIPQNAIVEVAHVFSYGAKKYKAYNFSAGARKTTYTDAAQRHINRYLLNEDIDPESGFNHLAHAVCCLLMLLDNDMIGSSIEDRNKHYK